MQVLTSLSGLQFSAVSAGFAPTNSADVSAIASAYQVVSSTGTQLHAGTAYLTGVNGAPISASRAGQAANASLANSAYYDGTGRLISALPDSAAVSAIASSYAESAASGKQDTIEFGYDANNLISSIDGSALAGQGGGGGGSVESPYGTIIVTDGTAIEATNSAIGSVPGEPEKFMNSAPATSQVSYWHSVSLFAGQSVSGASLMRLKALKYTYNPAALFTVSISGNPIGGGGEIVGTASATAYGSSMVFDFPLDPSWGFGTIWASSKTTDFNLDTADSKALEFYSATTASGVKELAWKDEIPSAVDIGIYENIYQGKYVTSINSIPVSAKWASSANYSYSAGQDPNGRPLTALAANSSVPTGITSPSGTIIANGFNAEATNSAFSTTVTPGYATTVVGWDFQVRPDTPLVCTLPSANSKSQVIVDLDWGTLTSIVSAVYDGITATATANGGGTAEVVLDVPNATRVEVYGSTYRNLIGSASASAADGIAPGSLGELAWASALPTYEYDGDGKISAIDGSALAGGGGGGVDSATVSAIASSYVESGVSSKLDSTAFNSGDFYSTGNPSGFVGSAYVESSVSAYQPLSGMSAYESSFSAGDGLEFVQSGDDRVLQVEAPVDIVAGPGIVIDNPDGNTLRVSTEADAETVLSNATYLMADNPTIILSEPAWNFEYVDIYALPHSTNFIPIVLRFKTGGLVSGNHGSITVQAHAGGGGIRLNNGLLSITDSGNLHISETKQFSIVGTTVSQGNAASSFVKVIGIHRIANN